jgi:hypothetical protein
MLQLLSPNELLSGLDRRRERPTHLPLNGRDAAQTKIQPVKHLHHFHHVAVTHAQASSQVPDHRPRAWTKRAFRHLGGPLSLSQCAATQASQSVAAVLSHLSSDRRHFRDLMACRLRIKAFQEVATLGTTDGAQFDDVVNFRFRLE